MDPALNFGSPAGIVQAIKGSEMAVRGVRQSGGVALDVWHACRYLLYDAAKFPVGLSSLGLVNISGFFLRGPPPPTPQSVVSRQLANPLGFGLSNGIE